MNNIHGFSRFCALSVFLCCVAAFLPACGSEGGRISIVSFADPYFPETTQNEMHRACYYADPSGDIHLACDTAGTAKSNDQAAAFLRVHIYWRPKPGKTHDDSTSADATIRYLVLTPQGARLYTGSAFVFPQIQRSSGLLTARIESARLRPATKEGQPPESLGEAKLTGVLTARPDRSGTIDLAGEMDRAAPQEQSDDGRQ